VLFAAALRRIVHNGNLQFTDSAGRIHHFGDGIGPEIAVRSNTARLDRMLTTSPTLILGEAYMDGAFRVERGSLYDFLALLARQEGASPTPAWFAALSRFRLRLKNHNPIGKARRNVAHHYDLSDRLYSLFLDEDRQYSCAYFTTPEDTLEQAQAAKKRHIAAKLKLDRPGLRVLDNWLRLGWPGPLSGPCGRS
jgi:cyclopropane-fatty-acyl-phospholipid synthase